MQKKKKKKERNENNKKIQTSQPRNIYCPRNRTIGGGVQSINQLWDIQAKKHGLKSVIFFVLKSEKCFGENIA